MKKFNLKNFDLLVKAIRSSRLLRRKLAQWSHAMFNAIYLPPPEDIAVPTAKFQKEIFALTEGKEKLVVIAGFRGCGKTSICTLSFVIWAIISGRAKFVVIASQTFNQARDRLGDIRRKFENNQLLRNDFGAMETEADQWGVNALNLKKYGARIIAVSTEQAIRGKLYDDRRPDIVICDDIEDSNSTRTQESRNKLYSWFTSEIVPLGTKDTRIFILGNFLHEFSLVGRLINEIQLKQRDGVAKRYPLLDDTGKCLWPGMYPDDQAIETLRRKVNDDAMWSREYLLTIIADDEKLVPLSYIHFYDPKDLPPKTDKSYLHTWSGVDLAIGQSSESDYTAIVSAQVYRTDEDLKIYILPDPIRKRLSFPDVITTMQNLLKEKGITKMLIETTNMQEAYYQQMFHDGYHQVESVKPRLDKRTRLALITKFIKDGTILFPRDRADQLIMELVGFGKENHDDLVDGLTMLVTKILEDHAEERPFRNWFNWVKRNGSMFIENGNSSSRKIGFYKPMGSKKKETRNIVNHLTGIGPRHLNRGDLEKGTSAVRVPRPTPSNPRDDSAAASLQEHLHHNTPKRDVRETMERYSYDPSSSSDRPSSGYSSGGYSSGGSSSGHSGGSSSGRSSGGGSIGDMLSGAAKRKFGDGE